MRIWLIKTGEEVPDDSGSPRLLRTGILARHLVSRGHDVTWWNATFNHQQTIQRADHSYSRMLPQGYRLIFLRGRGYARNISLARIISHIENAREFERLAPLQPRPDVIVCSYPTIELALAATRFAVRNRLPIAVDFRDMWPEVVSERVPGRLRFLAQPLLARWDRQQRYIVQNATSILGITDAFVDWALQKGDRPRGTLDRAFHLAVDPVQPEADKLRAAEVFWDQQGVAGEQIVLCFAGRLSDRLDLAAFVAGAMKLSESDRGKLKLVLCGQGDLEHHLRQMVGNASHVLLPRWRNAAEIAILLKRSQISLLPYKSSPDFLASYPNKIGEYLGAGLPIMTGLGGLTGQLLDARALRLPYREGDPESAFEALSEIASGRRSLEGYRKRALATFDELFNGKRIYNEFVDHIEALGESSKIITA